MSKAAKFLQYSKINESSEQSIKPPKLGTLWKDQGGVYVGIMGGKNNGPDYYLIHDTEDHDIHEVTWDKAVEEVKKPINGFNDWSLPNRREMSLIRMHPDHSFKLYPYWLSGEDNTDYAWMWSCGDYAGQEMRLKLKKLCARAVRRVYL